jgi:hypothetical protein
MNRGCVRPAWPALTATSQSTRRVSKHLRKKKSKGYGLKPKRRTQPQNFYVGIEGKEQDFETLIPGHQQWDPKVLEKQWHFNA